MDLTILRAPTNDYETTGAHARSKTVISPFTSIFDLSNKPMINGHIMRLSLKFIIMKTRIRSRL